jgi:hypothetical protein
MRKGGGILPHFFFVVEGGTAFFEFYMNRISMVLHGLYFGVALEYLSVLCCSSVFLCGVWCVVCGVWCVFSISRKRCCEQEFHPVDWK